MVVVVVVVVVVLVVVVIVTVILVAVGNCAHGAPSAQLVGGGPYSIASLGKFQDVNVARHRVVGCPKQPSAIFHPDLEYLRIFNALALQL